MPMQEIEGELLDSFNIAWETTDPIDVCHQSISMEVGFILEGKLLELIKPHETYAVSVIITKLEKRDAISEG